MQFNSGNNSIISDVRWWCRLPSDDTTLYPVADIRRNANMAMDRVSTLIMRSDNSWEWDDFNNENGDGEATLPLSTGDLEANQEDYALTLSHLKVIRVRVKDPNGNWLTLQPISRRELSDSQIASTGTPSGYDKLGNSIFLTPIPSYGSTEGLEIQYQRPAVYFDADSDAVEPGFAPQFHRLISLYAALDYCDIHLPDQAQKIRARIEALETELVDFYGDRDRDQLPKMTVEPTIEPF